MSDIDYEAISGILLKVHRAAHDMECLARAQGAYIESRPYEMLSKQNAGGAEYIFFVNALTPAPVAWSVTLGEIVHNMRSALDQCVYHLYRAKTGRYRNGTGFPVFTKPKDFRKYGLDDIRGLGSGPKTLVEWLQPYPERKERVHRSLRSLHDFWNQDKHRLVHLWGFKIDPSELELPLGSYLIPSDEGGVLRGYAEAFRIICVPPNPNLRVEMEGRIRVNVAIQHATDDAIGKAVSLWDTLDDIAIIVGSLLASMFRQDRPIVLRSALPRTWVPNH